MIYVLFIQKVCAGGGRIQHKMISTFCSMEGIVEREHPEILATLTNDHIKFQMNSSLG